MKSWEVMKKKRHQHCYISEFEKTFIPPRDNNSLPKAE